MADIIHGSTARPKPELTGAFTQYDPDDNKLVAGQVMPGIPTINKAGTITYPTRAHMLRLVDTERTPGDVFGRDVIGTDSTTYVCLAHGHEQKLPDEERVDFATAFNAELIKAKVARSRILLKRETRVKDLLFNTTTWTGGTLYTDVSAAPWDAAASDAIGHVEAAFEQVIANCGYPPNAMLVGHTTMLNLRKNTAILARIQNAVTLTQELIQQAIAGILGVPRIIVGDAIYNSADEGLTHVGAWVWPDDYALLGKFGTDGTRDEPCIGKTLYWTGMGKGGVAMSVYREEQTKSDVIRAESYEVEKVFDPYFGHLLKVDV